MHLQLASVHNCTCLYPARHSRPWAKVFSSISVQLTSLPRGPSLTDFSCLVSSCCSLSTLPLHLLGHSMGGGVALAAAALLPTLPVRSLTVIIITIITIIIALLPTLPNRSLTVFEPNLFSILAAGNSQERQVKAVRSFVATVYLKLQVLKAASHFFEAMLAAAEKEDWEVWGQTFHAFWFKGMW